MTPADLSRIADAIEVDAGTEAANWPLARERARAYVALARAALRVVDWLPYHEPSHPDYIPGASDAGRELRAALASLVPQSETPTP